MITFWGSSYATFNHFDIARFIDLCENRAKDRDKFEIILFHDPTVKDFKALDEKLKLAKEMYWRGRDLSFPVLLDSTGQTFKNFGLRGTGTSILIDPQGNLFGPAGQEQLEAKLPELPLDVRLAHALDKPIPIFFDDPKLDYAVKTLSDQAKIPIRLDVEKLAAEGLAVDVNMPFKFSNSAMSLRSVLNLLLDGMELGYQQDDKGLVIGPRRIRIAPRDQLSEYQRSSAKRMEKVLDRKVTFSFLNMTLNHVVQHFQNTTHENFVLEPADRRARLLDPNTKISGSAKDIPLREALERLLQPVKVGFVIRDEAVVLTYRAPER